MKNQQQQQKKPKNTHREHFDCLIPDVQKKRRRIQMVSNILFTCVHYIECVIHTDVAVCATAYNFFLWFFFFSLQNYVSCLRFGTRKTYLCTHTLNRAHRCDKYLCCIWNKSKWFFPYYYSHFRSLTFQFIYKHLKSFDPIPNSCTN